MNLEKLRALRARVAAERDRQPGRWWRIENRTATSAEVYLYGEIGGWGESAASFAAGLKEIGDVDELSVRINSPGGDYFDGVAIYNLLKSHRARVSVFVDGLAASAATVVMLAGDEIEIGENAQVMVHDASIAAWGNAAELREAADQLDKVSDDIAQLYAERAGGTRQEWRDRMRAETWMTAAEALAAGLVDRCGKPKGVAEDAAPSLPMLSLGDIFRAVVDESVPTVGAGELRAALDQAVHDCPVPEVLFRHPEQEATEVGPVIDSAELVNALREGRCSRGRN
jgi:ATP-dependent protease ClpP protease subunit